MDSVKTGSPVPSLSKAPREGAEFISCSLSVRLLCDLRHISSPLWSVRPSAQAQQRACRELKVVGPLRGDTVSQSTPRRQDGRTSFLGVWTLLTV